MSWPREVVLHERSGALTLAWDDGLSRRFSGSELRAACRCAGCEQQRRHGGGMPAAHDAAVRELLPVGEHAVQLRFSDGHERGIYPWVYLRELAGEQPS